MKLQLTVNQDLGIFGFGFGLFPGWPFSRWLFVRWPFIRTPLISVPISIPCKAGKMSDVADTKIN